MRLYFTPIIDVLSAIIIFSYLVGGRNVRVQNAWEAQQVFWFFSLVLMYTLTNDAVLSFGMAIENALDQLR